MKFNYNGLWKTLIDKNMKKKDLVEKTGISLTTISKILRQKCLEVMQYHSPSLVRFVKS